MGESTQNCNKQNKYLAMSLRKMLDVCGGKLTFWKIFFKIQINGDTLSES